MLDLRVPMERCDVIGEFDVGAVREATMSIPPHHLSPLRRGWESLDPALVHGVPDVVIILLWTDRGVTS